MGMPEGSVHLPTADVAAGDGAGTGVALGDVAVGDVPLGDVAAGDVGRSGSHPDLKTWAESAARSRLRPGATDVQVAAFTNVLLEAATDARQRAPIIAFAFCPDPAAGELARVEVRATEPTNQSLTETYGTRTPLSVHDPDIEYVTLPIGPGIRVAHQYASEAGPIQTYLYAVRPPELDVDIVMSLSWQTLYYSDRLFELGDDLAATLRIATRG